MEKLKKTVKELIPYIIIIIVVLLVKKFIFTPVIVNGKSMMTTLHENDIMILDKLGMRLNGIKRFDIVVIQTERGKIIKRVIGLPGETIQYKDNILYINGKEIEDPYPSTETNDIQLQEIPEGMYFVLGDNRGDSLDSEELGPFAKNKILGHATYIIYPFNRFGSK